MSSFISYKDLFSLTPLKEVDVHMLLSLHLCSWNLKEEITNSIIKTSLHIFDTTSVGLTERNVVVATKKSLSNLKPFILDYVGAWNENNK